MDSRIVVEVESIRTTNSSDLFGKIYLAADANKYFPELGWTDFVGSVLDHLLKAVGDLSPKNGFARVPFLDGPFALEFIRRDEQLEISCKRSSTDGESEVLIARARHQAFKETLFSIAESILQICDREGWQDFPVASALRFRVTDVKRDPAI